MSKLIFCKFSHFSLLLRKVRKISKNDLPNDRKLYKTCLEHKLNSSWLLKSSSSSYPPQLIDDSLIWSFHRKLLSGSVDSLSIILLLINLRIIVRYTRNISTFFIPRCTRNYSKHEFITRVMKLANNDPSEFFFDINVFTLLHYTYYFFTAYYLFSWLRPFIFNK